MLLRNLSGQEEQTCGYLNRQGRLCGKCKPNHSISAYSYDIKCHTSSVWRNVVEYVCIAYLPLTIFLCVVIVFHISVTSPAMNVPVVKFSLHQHLQCFCYNGLETHMLCITSSFCQPCMEFGTWTSFAHSFLQFVYH